MASLQNTDQKMEEIHEQKRCQEEEESPDKALSPLKQVLTKVAPACGDSCRCFLYWISCPYGRRSGTVTPGPPSSPTTDTA